MPDLDAPTGRDGSTALEQDIRAEIADAEREDRPIRRMLRTARAWVARHPRVEIAYRVGVAVVGTIMALGGLVLVPLPGPGWLIVFLGLAVLGTEFHWARRLSGWVKRMLDRFWQWWRQRRAARAADLPPAAPRHPRRASGPVLPAMASEGRGSAGEALLRATAACMRARGPFSVLSYNAIDGAAVRVAVDLSACFKSATILISTIACYRLHASCMLLRPCPVWHRVVISLPDLPGYCGRRSF